MRKIASYAIAVIALMTFAGPAHAAPSSAQKSETLAARASQQAASGLYAEAENNYRKALAADPVNVEALNGLFALYRQQAQATKMQLLYAQLTQAQRDVLGSSLKRIEVDMLQMQADQRLGKGQLEEAIKYMEQAVKVDADDPALCLKLAKFYQRRGSQAMAQALLGDFVNRRPHDADVRYALAQALAGQGDNKGALESLALIDPDKRSPGMVALQQRLMVQSVLQEATSLNDSGKHAEAVALLSRDEDASAGNEELMLAVAFAWAEIGETGRGKTLFDKVQAAHATPMSFRKLDPDSWDGLVRILVASGKRDEAMRQMDEWEADSRGKDLNAERQLAASYASLGEYDRALQTMDTLLAAHPDAAYLLYDAWKLAEQAGQLDRETGYLKKLVIAFPSERAAKSSEPVTHENAGIGEFGSDGKLQRDWKERKLAALIDRRSRWISGAIDSSNRSGTPGMSEIHLVEMPLEYRTPWHSNDEVFFRSDLVKVGAGTLDSARTDFGSMEFCQPNCTAASLDQSAQGASLTAGYLHGDVHADIGVTPLNFPVSNVVGGVAKKGDLGQFGYSLEASRRPLTASLLSYAGTKDPDTGRTWGGVVATGASAGLSLDSGGSLGFWSSLGLHALTGHNVQSSRRFQLMAGEQWRVVNEDNRRFVIGLTVMYWNFARDAGEYTFGHGGYYSPQNYRSYSIPITWTARTPRFSYMLRASASVSDSQTCYAPYYPTDAALQAAASTNSYYATSSGYGKGFSVQGAWEHQVRPQLFFGGLLSIDRSYSYTPNRALVYLRYSLDHAGAQPVNLPPEPVVPSSQF